MSGVEWQKRIEDLLKIKYRTDYRIIPDQTQGDHGVEGFSKDGKAYQCYAAAENSQNLYAKQRQKITDDIGKFVKNVAELKSIFDLTVINEWILVVPLYNDKALLKHASKKAEEVRKLNLPTVSKDFTITIATEKDFWRERQIYHSADETNFKLPENPWARILYENLLYSPLPKATKESLSLFAESAWTKLVAGLQDDASIFTRIDRNLPRKHADNFQLLFKTELNHWELVLLYVTSILREFIVKTVLHKSIEEGLDRFDFETEKIETNDLIVAYKYFFLKNPRFRRQIERLTSQGDHATASTASLTLLERSIVFNPKTWRSVEDGGFINIKDMIETLFDDESADLKFTLRKLNVLRLTSNYIRESSGFDPTEENVIKDKDIIRLSNGTTLEIRTLMLAIGCSVSERMALDFATLDEVLFDHLNDCQSWPSKYEEIGHSTWSENGNLIYLNTTTSFPEIDFALRSQIELLNIHTNILSFIVGNHFERLTDDLKLPRFSQEKITVQADSTGKGLFRIPHLSFKLAEKEVKELLIGGAIYQQNHVSIRELYQNALDACRYRKARYQYLSRKPGGNPICESNEHWNGKIRFRQGTENGRNFIECTDNGVGMGYKEIRECFAKAGRRYTDQNEFFDEKLAWEKVDPPVKIFPNSQFGIGVFSYFLISDEIVVRTRRMDIDGNLKETIEVTIKGSGNLCTAKQIENVTELFNGGTMIRIYLNPDVNIQMIESLRFWLFIAEFETKATSDTDDETWFSNTLKDKGNYFSNKTVIPTDDPDIFISVGKEFDYTNRGLLLQDGIRINEVYEPLIVNLMGSRKSKTSVDRNRFVELIAIDIQSTLPKEKLETTRNFLVSNIEKLSMFQMSVLFERFPLLVGSVLAIIFENKISKRLKFYRDVDPEFDIAKVGLYPFDYLIIGYLSNSGSESEKLRMKEDAEGRYSNEIFKRRWSFWNDVYQGLPQEDSIFAVGNFAPLDYYYLDQTFKIARLPLEKIEFSTIAIYRQARELNVSPQYLYSCIAKFSVFGLAVPTFEYDPQALQLIDLHIELLQARQGNSGGWLTNDISMYDIFLKSVSLNVTVGKIVELLDLFKSHGVFAPAVIPSFYDYQVTNFDLSILGCNSTHMHWGHYRNKIVDNQRIFSIARQLKLQLIDVYNHFIWLSPLFNFRMEVEKSLVENVLYNFDTNQFEVKDEAAIIDFLRRRGVIFIVKNDVNP